MSGCSWAKLLQPGTNVLKNAEKPFQFEYFTTLESLIQPLALAEFHPAEVEVTWSGYKGQLRQGEVTGWD